MLNWNSREFQEKNMIYREFIGGDTEAKKHPEMS